MNGKAKLKLGLIGLFVLAALGVALLMAASPAGAVITGDTPPSMGDWVIENPTRVIDQPVDVYGNLYVNDTLELWNATIIMHPGYDNQYMVRVNATGNMKANHSVITSYSTSREFGFQVYGPMNLFRVHVSECYQGMRIMTEAKVTIENSLIDRCYGNCIYLEDADNTTLRNLNIQSNEVDVDAGTISVTSVDYYDRPTITISGGGGALFVKGGNPTLDNINVSVNGTMRVTVDFHKYYYYAYGYFYLYFPVVGIDSKEMTTVKGINVYDCNIDFRIHYNLYDYYGYGYFYLYSYSSGAAVNVANYKDVTLKGCSARDVEAGSTSTSYSLRAGYIYGVYYYKYSQGMKLFAATVTEKLQDPGPHRYRVTLSNMEFENVGVLAAGFTPDYNGTLTPTYYTEYIIDNVKVNKGSYPFEVSIGPQFSAMKEFYSLTRISNSTFTNMTGPIIQESISAGPGVDANKRTFDIHDTILVENNVFQHNSPGTYGLFYEPSQSKAEYNNLYETHFYIRKNDFLDHKGRIAYIYGNSYTTRGFQRLTFEGNYFHNCTDQTSDYPAYVYYKNRITFHDNYFDDMVYYYPWYIMAYGGDSNGKKPALIKITNNTFRRSYNTYDYYYYKGIFRLYFGGDAEVAYNNVSGVELCFINIYEYTYYAGYTHVTFHHNELFNNNGTFLYFAGYSTYHPMLTVEIFENKAWNNAGMFTDYYEYATYLENYDYDATITFINNTVVNTTGTVFRNYGKLTITGNKFVDCLGYVIEIDYLNVHTPVINNNDIKNCENVYYIGAKPKGALKMGLTVEDLSVDCTGNAFYFKNVDATMDNISITQRTSMAIIAEEANVDAVSSSVPIGSGQVIGSGEINVWYEIEVFVEWSNLTHPDESSGVRVEDALVVLYGRNGAYYTSAYTDENGHLKRMRLPQWSVVGSFVSIWSPYKVTAAKNGVTSTTDLPLTRDYVDEDAIRFLLEDDKIPVIRVTSPFPNDLFNVANITLRGFSTEVGSGIGTIEVAMNDGEWMEVEFDAMGDFVHVFVDVDEGDPVLLHARVFDRAKNVNQTTVEIVVDRTPPRLVVHYPDEGITVNDENLVIVAEYEPGSTITINGLEREGTSGTLNAAYILSEGSNTIIVEATDPAGNVAMVTRNVRLDRFAPTLTVLAPRDGLVVKVTSIDVEGIVELGSEAYISVYRTGENLINETIDYSNTSGAFTHMVDLEEGDNVIVVRTVDSAGNNATVARTVHVDTTKPICEITSPADGLRTSDNIVRVIGTSEVEGITLYLNGKQIFNTGSVDRTVNLNEGPNKITLRAVDTIGNVYENSVTVYLDTKAPEITIDAPAAEYLRTNNGELHVAGKVTGFVPLAGFDYEMTILGQNVDLTPDANGLATFDTTVTMPEEGLVEVLLVVYDEADNMATKSIMVDYSTAAPELSVVYSPDTTPIESDDSTLFIYGTTTAGIREVVVSHESGGVTVDIPYTVAEDGSFSIAWKLLDGSNSFTLAVEDVYGNTATSDTYTVSYTYVAPPSETETKDKMDPAAISSIFLAVSIALIATAIVVSRSFRARE